jgi:hypothetical protein
MQRGCDSVPIVVEEEKHAMSLSIQTSHGWAVPGPVLAFMPVEMLWARAQADNRLTPCVHAGARLQGLKPVCQNGLF